MHHLRYRTLLIAGALAMLPAWASAQQGATITGRVTSDAGVPLPSASVFLEGMNLGALTRDDGGYAFSVPAGRVTGQQVQLTARLVGYRSVSVPITLSAGTVTRDFTLAANPLQLGEVVVTGAGTTSAVEKLGNVRNNVSAELIERSNEPNVVQALAGKAPNVRVTQSSGEPGASSSIRIRGQRTLTGTGEPLFIVDGVPIDNSSRSTSNFNPLDELGTGEIAGTSQSNRASDINPHDIESVEILKGPAAGAIYGARAGQGVVLITTKKGRPGRTQYSLRSSLSFDDITRTYPLQRRFGQGLNGVSALPCNDINKPDCLRSWGPELAPGTPTYDHANEAYDTGNIFDNTLTVSGGSERTTFFFSGAYLRNEGVFKGPHNEYERTTLRVNASHRLLDNLNLGANVSYADVRGDFVQRGNNVNGLQLGLLRTPPEFNNLPYLDPVTGQHRSYRLQNPTIEDALGGRGFDNPFFALNEPVALSNVGRVFGNVSAEYQPLEWLTVNYSLGGDYSNDERLEAAPITSSGVAGGSRVTEGKIVNYQIDHNLTATATYRLSDNFAGTVTLGQNLNARNNRQLANVGRTLIAPRPFKLSNTITRDLPVDSAATIHSESYFGQATLDLWDQLYLTAALRNDGSSTFGRDNLRSWYPKASASWAFAREGDEERWLSFGKLRASYGEAGQEPAPYLNSTTFDGVSLLSGVVQGTGLSPTLAGFGGLVTSTTKGADNLKPERTKEFEAGFDVGVFQNRADFSFTFYNANTEDVILITPLAPSSGFFVQAQNSAKIRNRGVELSLNVRPITTQNFSWDVGVQWARNKSKVTQLAAAEFIPLDGTNNLTPYNVAREGEEVGVFYDLGFVRCGISPEGLGQVVEGVDLAEVCAGQPRGALYLDSLGFPVGDNNLRVIGNPNPNWTGSLRTGVNIRGVSISALADIKHGGHVHNGTKGALYSYGTHKDTEIRGQVRQFGQNGWFEGPVVGPGAGKPVVIDQAWFTGLGSCVFSGFNETCIEDGGYVKLREISVGYTFDQQWVQNRLGLSSIDVRVAGRNLKTWTDYTGYDPETNLGGSIQRTQGLDYFNMPQTRSFVFSIGLNR